MGRARRSSGHDGPVRERELHTMTTFGLSLALAASLGAAAPAADAAQAASIPAKPGGSTRMECRIAPGFAPSDHAAREKQVASVDQRIAARPPERFPEEARRIADSLQAFFGSKEAGVPSTFATMFKHPGLYREQLQLGLELNQNGKLPPRERELAILRVA